MTRKFRTSHEALRHHVSGAIARGEEQPITEQPAPRYAVVESKVWRNAAGRQVSIYGALPWYSEAQRMREGWELISCGWTVFNPLTNQVGICRPPWATREEAEAYAASHRPSRIGYGD